MILYDICNPQTFNNGRRNYPDATVSGNRENSVKTYSNYFLTTTQIFGLRFEVVGINSELFRRCGDLSALKPCMKQSWKNERQPLCPIRQAELSA